MSAARPRTATSPPSRWCSRKTAGPRTTPRFFFHASQLRGLAPAGRLDIDSTGLLVLTQDGRVARQLIGEDSAMEKEYLVRVSLPGHRASPCAATANAPTQLSRIDDDDPVSTDVQAVFPPAMLARCATA